MEQQYLVTFSGDTTEGVDRREVGKKLARAMSKDENYSDVLLSGKSYILKRTTDFQAANDTVTALKNHGALAQVVTQPTAASSATQTATIINQVSPDSSVSANKQSKQSLSFEDNTALSPQATRSWVKSFQYRFDSFMAKGSASSFKALLFVFIATFLLIAGLRGLLFWALPDLSQQYESLDLLGNIYITFLQLTDPGNMAQDILSSYWYKLFAVLAGMFGVIMLSALVAVITTGLDQKLTDLKRGRSKVIEDGHTLLIGWDEQRIIEILRELVLANESEKDACVVILADKDKQEMDEALRLRIQNFETTRIVTRTGKGTILNVLDTVSVDTAKSVILLASCTDTDTESEKMASDAQIIQTVLAVSTKSVEKDNYAVVAEIYNNAYRDILDNTFPDYVVTLDAGNILAKLLVQTSRSVGLSVVYSEILSFDGCEMYFHDEQWPDIEFSDLAYRFPDGVPIGIRKADGNLLINPARNYRMQPSDEILIVADDDSTIEFLPQPVIEPQIYPIIDAKAEQHIERELIVGWNQKSETIINEFSAYVKEGSEIDIIVHTPTDAERAEIARINQENEQVEISLLTINPLDRNALIGIEPAKYNNIIILASIRDDKELQQVDSENIVILLLLRNIFDELPQACDTKLITEVLESQNQALVAKAGVKDMIISNQLISMITAQTSESPGIKDVYDDLFQEDGSEIYLKPLSLYFDSFPVSVCFADLIAVAGNRDEICFGIKITADEYDQSKNNGIQLIPEKSQTFTLSANDCLVVVAEDEL